MFPKTEFRLIVDPACLDTLLSSLEPVLQLIIDLSLATPSVRIRLITEDGDRKLDPLFERLSFKKFSRFIPKEMTSSDPREKLLCIDLDAVRLNELCAASTAVQADGIVTDSKSLIEARYPLYQNDVITVVHVSEIGDFVEICAHGHNIFWSASYDTALTHDIYYPLAHKKCARLAGWWNSRQALVESDEVKTQLRSMLLNRYPFMLYARDMVRFYQLQKDSATRERHFNWFVVSLSYHVNMFYLLLWGTLDQLCLLANLVLALELSASRCGIKSSNFWEAIADRKPGLVRFRNIPTLDEWIDTMRDMRHSAAHQVIPMPSVVYAETEESKKPKEEILKAIRAEGGSTAALLDFVLPTEARPAIEEQLVSHWRVEKMRTLADHVVLLKGKNGYYWRSPVVSVDHDLAMVTAVMDAFLIGLFSKRAVSQ
jgi:hypothetical protein